MDIEQCKDGQKVFVTAVYFRDGVAIADCTYPVKVTSYVRPATVYSVEHRLVQVDGRKPRQLGFGEVVTATAAEGRQIVQDTIDAAIDGLRTHAAQVERDAATVVFK